MTKPEIKRNLAIEYPKENNEDIFTKLINFLKSLQLMTQRNKKLWSYFLYGTLLLILGVIVYLETIKA